MWFLLSVFAAEPEPSVDLGFETICVTREDGPPRAALAIAASQLPWAHKQRVALREGDAPIPVKDELLSWLDVKARARLDEAVGLEVELAQSPFEGEYVLGVELGAKRRGPLILPNFTVVVDLSRSMDSVFTRRIPVLEDEVGETFFRPITRLDLVKDALRYFVHNAPAQSKISIVGMDTFQAKVLLEPTQISETAVLLRAIRQLRPGVIASDGEKLRTVLSRTSARTFDKCHDNKVLLFTDHVSEAAQKQAINLVRRWSEDDVQVWAFGVGVLNDADVKMKLLEEASGGAAWVINTRHDAQTIWDVLLDPGGRVARNIGVKISVPEGTLWRTAHNSEWSSRPIREQIKSFDSGGQWARIFELKFPEEADPTKVKVDVTHADGHLVWSTERPPDPFPMSVDWLRTRAIAGWWTDGVDVSTLRASLGEEGQATEVRAWIAHQEKDKEKAKAP